MSGCKEVFRFLDLPFDVLLNVTSVSVSHIPLGAMLVHENVCAIFFKSDAG